MALLCRSAVLRRRMFCRLTNLTVACVRYKNSPHVFVAGLVGVSARWQVTTMKKLVYSYSKRNINLHWKKAGSFAASGFLSLFAVYWWSILSSVGDVDWPGFAEAAMRFKAALFKPTKEAVGELGMPSSSASWRSFSLTISNFFLASFNRASNFSRSCRSTAYSESATLPLDFSIEIVKLWIFW